MESRLCLVMNARYNYFRFVGRHLVLRASVDVGGCWRESIESGDLRNIGITVGITHTVIVFVLPRFNNILKLVFINSRASTLNAGND